MTDFYLNSKNFLPANAVDKPSTPLTLDDLRKAAQALRAIDTTPKGRAHVTCHPLEYPFFCVFFGGQRVMDHDRVIRWYFECLRKHRMGAKTGDPRWTLKALVSQYTAKIAAIEVVEWPKTDILKGI